MLFRSKPAWRLCAGSIFKCVSFKVFLFSPGRSGPRVSSRPKFGHLRSVKIKQPTFLDQNNFELKRGYSFLNCAIKSHCCFRTHMRWLTLISSGCHDCCTNCSFTFRAWLQNVCNTHTQAVVQRSWCTIWQSWLFLNQVNWQSFSHTFLPHTHCLSGMLY